MPTILVKALSTVIDTGEKETCWPLEIIGARIKMQWMSVFSNFNWPFL